MLLLLLFQNNYFVCDLRVIFEKLADNTRKEAAQPSKLFRDFRDSEGNSLDPDEQQDAAFFFDELIRALDSDIIGDTLRGLLSTQYVVQRIYPKGHVHEVVQTSLYNPLPINSDISHLTETVTPLEHTIPSPQHVTIDRTESMYHLHGVISHRGSLKTGHYISYVRQHESSE